MGRSKVSVVVVWVALLLLAVAVVTAAQSSYPTGETHYYTWDVVTTNVTRNCQSVNITTVNGLFPGPTIEITEGDTVVINVTNKQSYPVSLHWHGIFQFMTNWADGPAHITQCPLKEGDSQIYEFTVTGQSGTFFWHAHNNWLRATVFGAFIVHPKEIPYYGEVAGEHTFMSGEWYNQDPNVVEQGFINVEAPTANATYANAVNGQPGPNYGCPDPETFQVTNGSTYLLRLVNAGLNNNHYFKVANHTLKVVAADGNFLKNFTTDLVVIAPGQTTNVLMTTDQALGSYYAGISLAYVIPPPGETSSEKAALAIIGYEGANSSETPTMPEFPSSMDPVPLNAYAANLTGLDAYDLPETMDHELVYVVAISLVECVGNESCTLKLAGTVQNITFDDPQNITILEAYYNGVPGVYTNDFPDMPPAFIDFPDPANPDYMRGIRGTRVRELEFNDTVQVVLQNAHGLGIVDHPFHLHGHDFYVVGQNFSGNFDPTVTPSSFNLVDPPKFNTISLPSSGWIAIRFRANNPGVWLFHCHFERHKTWGMQMVFITKNGFEPNEQLPGPLHPLPPCP